ncbi:MAG: hypothetical protein EHM70_16905 [Chloroflexota bacterium]|nr:MAG: hypothetical protein EHM70_16905 [Chloroflexota bacterium]
MEEFFQDLLATITAYLPTLLIAIGILILGWLLAWVLSAAVGAILRRVSVDDRLAAMATGQEGKPAQEIHVERWVSGGVFWVVILFAVIAFLQALNLTVEDTGPFSSLLGQALAFIPRLISALVLLLLAWIVATVLRFVVVRLINASGLARRLSTDAQVRTPDRTNISQTIGNVVYASCSCYSCPPFSML